MQSRKINNMNFAIQFKNLYNHVMIIILPDAARFSEILISIATKKKSLFAYNNVIMNQIWRSVH